MIQKDSGYLSEQSNKLKQRSDSNHLQLKPHKRKETADKGNSSNQKQNISNKKNRIFKQYIAGGNQFQSQLIDHQKSTNTFNQVNEGESSGLQRNPSVHSTIKHTLPPKPSIKASPLAKVKQQYPQYPRELNLKQQISNSKKQKGEQTHTHLSNFGMQAMGGSQIMMAQQHRTSKDHLQQISSSDLLASVNQINQHYKQEQQLFEDTKKEGTKYQIGTMKPETSQANEHPQIQNQVSLEVQRAQMNNNLNKALSLQIQPQKNKRGQRRHFPVQNELNEFELLMKNNQQQMDSVQSINGIKQDHLKKINQISQSTGGKKLIRRGPFAVQNIFDQEPQRTNSPSFTAQGESSANIQSHLRLPSNPRSAYQKSIFQKNRQKITINSQSQVNNEGIHSSETPVGTNYQFKGLFQQNTNSQTGGNLMSQYGQNVLNRSSPKQQNNLSQNQYGSSQYMSQIGGRGFNLQKAQLQGSSSKAKLNDNPNNISVGSNAEPSSIAKENLFSPQPKPSSQMSQYNENAKQINSNTAQIIIRKAKAQNLEQFNDNRHYSLNKTDEKQKSNKKINNDAQHIHNFRKYKKQTPQQRNETNVLGQPKSQYKNDELTQQRNQDGAIIGTGLYPNQRRNYFTKQEQKPQQDQTSLNLPSMISNKAEHTQLNKQTLQDRQQTIQPNSIRRKTTKHSSIFNMTNFSGAENIVQDVNYNIKGSKDTQRIAWEIKFNKQDNSQKQSSNDENQINQSQDFIYTELQKHRQTQDKSPLIKQFRQNLVTNRSTITGGGNTAKTTDTRGVKVLKVQTKTQRLNVQQQTVVTGESPPVQSTSQSRSINQGGLPHGSGETSNRDNPKIFRRQVGAIKLKDIRDHVTLDPSKTVVVADKNVIQKLEEHKHKKIRIKNEKIKNATFKKSLRTVRQQIRQYEGEIPAELIVTGYKHGNNTTMNSNTQSNDTTLKEKPSLKLMNFVGQTPLKDSSKAAYLEQANQLELKGGKEVFAYKAGPDEKDEDFFKTTSEGEFNEYMKQHQTEDQSLIQSSEVVNPSANPTSDQNDSEFSRDISESDDQVGNSSVNINLNQKIIRPQLENEIVQGKTQKNIVRKVSHQSNEFSINQSKMTPNTRHHASHQLQNNYESSIYQQQNQWSGVVSAQTQFLFNRVVNQNQKIHEKLKLLQDVGFHNKSNSLYKQILEDIQAAERGMTRNEIINCIEASSFGRISAIEPHHSTDQKSAKIWLGVRRSQQQQIIKKKVHYSGSHLSVPPIISGMQSSQFNKVKSKSVKSFFWIKNTQKLSKNKNKRIQSRSFQQFKLPIGADHETQNLLQQSYNFTVVRSLNLKSSHQNDSRGFKKMAFNKNSGKANTVRNYNSHTFNQNRINLNRPRQDVRQSEVFINNQRLSSDELRKIQTERKIEGKNYQRKVIDLSSQEYLKQEKAALGQNTPRGLLNQQAEFLSCVKVQQFIHPLNFTKQPAIRYDFQNIKRNTNSDSFSQLHSNSNCKELLITHSNSESHHNAKNNVVLLAVKPSALLFDQNQHKPISDNNKNSHQQSSNSLRTNQPQKTIANKKFTSYGYHNVQEPVSSNSVPSQSHNSLPTLQDCNSSNVRYKRDLELQSSNGGNGTNNKQGSLNSNDRHRYTAKYKKSIQIAEGKKLEKSGAFGKSVNNEMVAEPVEQGRIIKWRQGEIIGLGSSSVVYSAFRTDTGQVIAVKKFKVVNDITGVDQSKLQTIKNEIQKYKQLDHKNIVKFFGCELLNQFFCIYLEKLDTSLANILSDHGNFDEQTIKSYTQQILDGLKFLHDKKIKHLDLKCSNILTNSLETNHMIKLCDFGSAKEFKKDSNQILTSFTSMQSQIVGSIQWMSPEIIAKEGSGSKSDIWSLGCTIVEMFIGGNPWGDKLDDQNLFLAQKIILNSDELPTIPEDISVSKQCHDFIGKCLTRKYNKRPSAAMLLEHPWIKSE